MDFATILSYLLLEEIIIFILFINKTAFCSYFTLKAAVVMLPFITSLFFYVHVFRHGERRPVEVGVVRGEHLVQFLLQKV